MNDVRELLALLAAHGIDPLKVHGGVPSITQMDVAGMMARCTQCEAALLRAKYCGEPVHEAWAFWFQHLMEQGWASKKPRAIETLSIVTLAEHVSDNRCGLCRGTQGWYVGSKYQPCPACRASGVIYLSNREIAGRLGFEDEGLKEPWLSRLGWCRAELVLWEQRAIAKVR